MAKKAKLTNDMLLEQKADQKQMGSIYKAVDTARAMKAEIEQFEEVLTAKKAEYVKITQETIPALMAGLGIGKMESLDKRASVVLGEFWSGSLPKEPAARKEALSWLRKEGAASLIQNQVSMSFGKGQDKLAKEVMAHLRKLKVDFQSETGVHAQRLYAYARERMGKGEPVPLKKLGLFTGQVAKIKVLGEKKNAD